MADKRSLLILSLSDISQDARVLKQVALFKDDWYVITCGYGPKPPGAARHIEIPPEEISMRMDGRLITLKQYRLVYWTMSSVRAMRRLTAPLRGKIDVILADEIETVPVALSLHPKRGIHADLHEYTPSLYENLPLWDRRIKPFYEWLTRTYAVRANSWSSPSEGVSRKYEEMFGFLPVTVTNATPQQDLVPTEVSTPIRMVHHGGAQRGRRAEVMIEAVRRSSTDLTFDLYLTGVDPEYREELRTLVEGDPKIRVHDAVPYEKLIETINAYDLGIHILPPLTFNNTWALPNKLFDFVQARLGQITGPTAEMAELVSGHEIGAVTGGYEVEDIVPILDALTVEQVSEWKKNAHKSAHALSSEVEVPKWREAVEEIWATGE